MLQSTMSKSRDALMLYKSLHRTIQRVFKGDQAAMFAARDKVYEEFIKYRNVRNDNAREGLMNQGREAQRTLAELVVQIEKVDQDKYQMNIRDETHKFENNPFRDDISETEYRAANKRAKRRGACDEKK